MVSEPTIYILDDDVQYSGLLSEVAMSEGWHVVSESNPVVFLEYSICHNSLLVLDLNMPEMDGIEVIRALAKRKIDITLILISGFDSRVLHSAKQLAEAHNIRVLCNLTKPVDILEFIKVLDSVKFGADTVGKTVDVYKPITAEEFERGILQHQLVVHYQPQVNVKTGALVGVEALVRWMHPDRGIIFPEQFIAMAENQALIGMLTEEVFVMAAKQSQYWQAAGLDIVVSINISPESITSLDLPEQLTKLIEIYGINPEKFNLEITETAVMEQLTSSLDVLNRLRMKGFLLSIDDFGTGHSSLTQLYQAPFSEIKIDQHFVLRMLGDPEAMVIVEICIMLGKKMGMLLVAEGVETKGVLDKLRELGCDRAQGDFIGKPMEADELINWNNHHYDSSCIES